ncbi:lysophospholipid acyltransferase 1 [Spea bombifrons]|uniref:lysophospholipid acyltransferase 1 n=1 Tax=Spea bombifrons TaxID=233779 RepID=UPI00234B441B|nr:lysophospholipid acyltransferase 1 [Spea bombifrons]
MAAPDSDVLRTTGSTLLRPVSERLHIPLYQVNFVVCQLIALVTATWFRIYLSPCHAHTAVRHAFATLLGVYFTIFCFGWYSLHIFTMVLLCYYIMVKASAENVHRYSFVISMGYLTLCHINRVYVFSYGILSTDFSGPLMILTQKITSLAFQLHDGMGQNSDGLNVEQRKYSVKKKPTFLEYMSYHLNFMSVLAGPCSNYQDYIAFIEGSHVSSKLLEVNSTQNGHHKLPNPSPNEAVANKLCTCVVCLGLFFTFTKAFPVAYVVSDVFIKEAPLWVRVVYLYIAIQASKPKYYFAWTLADAINNAAGFGFNGVDEKGRFQWNLISSLNIWNIETSTSFKMYIDNWNIQTGAWLKRVCYDRAPRYRTGLTFILSAMWHGVYPGYYFTFFTAIPTMLAARLVRKNFRHLFITSKSSKVLYDVVTWIVTQVAVCYTVSPFVLLGFEPTIKLYRSMYFYFHIAIVLVIILLPTKPHCSSQRKSSKETEQAAQYTTNHIKKN